jgi:hypothetical protein
MDLNLSQSDYEPVLRRAAAEAKALGMPLGIALHLFDAAEELKALVTLPEQVRPTVCTWFIFHVAGKSMTEEQYLTSYTSEAKFGAGTDAYFTELNRGRPLVTALDLVATPSIHRFTRSTALRRSKPAKPENRPPDSAAHESAASGQAVFIV